MPYVSQKDPRMRKPPSWRECPESRGVADYALTEPARGQDVTEAQQAGGPTVRRMLVGSQLRRLRVQSGISREEAGARIRASEWKIHRLENGQVGFKERDVVDLLSLYGVTDRAEIGALDETPEAIERRVELRVARQALLTRAGPPRLWAVVDEGALRRPVGGPRVMRAQIERLIEASRLPSVVLQILPFGAGAHPAMGGAFSILRFADDDLPD